MEQTCHRCGATIPEDAPFCSQCGAPQVRVPETITAAPVQDGAATAAQQELLSRTSSGPAVNWRHALPSASTAGFAMAVASMLPLFNNLFPIWMLGGGWLAVTLYRRRASLLIASASIGAKVGAFAGLFGFLFFAVFTSAYLAVATVVLHQGEQIRAMLRGVLQQAAAANQDPRAQAIAQWVQTPEGLALILIFSMVLFLFAFLLLSCAGGMFAVSFSRRKLR